MNQDKFTEKAQEVLQLSLQLVQQYKHSQLDVEHIFFALLTQEKGLVSDIIKETGADIESLKANVQQILERIPKVQYFSGQIYTTPRILALQNAATAEAKQFGDEFISTEHIFLAIIDEGA
ncbi:MAG TPA: Clp protease N-terminal domain-containing protein, partial [Dehalococcoidales bacterium]|nr:Clp protease N-terminal domain-containing protein [Dehalococcoidales bacterium]